MTKSQKTKAKKSDTVFNVTKYNDIITNDFNLSRDKVPPLSTIKTQLKNAENLLNTTITTPARTEFDRLRIGINLNLHGVAIEFEEWGMEDVEKPQKHPSFMDIKQQTTEDRERMLEAIMNYSFDIPIRDEDNDNNAFELFEDLEEDFIDLTAEPETVEDATNTDLNNNELDIIHDKTIKRRIRYGDYRPAIGLLNMFICNGFFVIDLTGKWMADNGILGSLHQDNIREALQKVIDLNIVSFNIERFINHAQIFVCDVCIDLALLSDEQVKRYIDGVSSFFPIASERYNISKYGRHGLMMKPKRKKAGHTLTIYSKGQELSNSTKRSTRATRYTEIIGQAGEELAKRVIRLEVKLFDFKNIREVLNIPADEPRVIRLLNVLNSAAPVMLRMFEEFSGTPKELLDRLEWLEDIETAPEKNFTLSEIFIAERFIEIFKENLFDLELTKKHIKTEYINARDKEIEQFNRLANLKRNTLNFLVYCKPKSVTIMLDMLARLYAHYSTGMGDTDNV